MPIVIAGYVTLIVFMNAIYVLREYSYVEGIARWLLIFWQIAATVLLTWIFVFRSRVLFPRYVYFVSYLVVLGYLPIADSINLVYFYFLYSLDTFARLEPVSRVVGSVIIDSVFLLAALGARWFLSAGRGRA